ncbi:nucleotidyltransferase family protein [Paenibacillus sp. SYP-B3998]|uniref:Nucleotidyltransferase family protein n=1 Tax=Paenibacillus sp. SYP-B3998 TaxID=2678564 RepID=A0A6G4A0G3_9BACL|nr:nucleotidyltransferase family protein [Paenibacillus sp. SYP-B3998]NEW07137.1 nucleotidyltransferase family protein [Paenibacillus sp. SYP-B3998]
MDNEFARLINAFPKELKWLLSLLHIDKQDSESQTAPSNMDWDYFLKVVKHHRVYPLVYSILKNADQDLIPDNVLHKLRSDYNRNTFHMLHLSSEMESVCKSLRNHQVLSLMLKGPVLSQELYGDLSLRTSKDLDILVPMEDVEKAEQILMDLGYEVNHEFPRILGDWKWRFHHISFFHAQKRIQLELHWRLNPEMGMEPKFHELWDRSRVSTITKYPVHFLGNEDLFLYLVSHGARHAWFRLRWLVDIDKIVHKGLDWTTLRELLQVYKSNHVGGQALLLIAALFGTEITHEMSTLIEGKLQRKLAINALAFIRTTINLCSEPHPELDKQYRRYMYRLRWGQQKWNFIMRRFYPSSTDAVMLPLPKALHFLYVPLRPFLWLLRQIKQQSSL